jgi:general secretion pathway protein K
MAMLVMITFASLEIGAAARPRRLAAAAQAEREAALQAATAGVEHAQALLRRLEPVSPGRLTREPGGTPDPWGPANGAVIGPEPVGAYAYRAELHDAYERLHLNGASEDQLRRLFLALRIDARRADRLAQAIADWRDADVLRRGSGAERGDYLRAGRPFVPRDGPFATVDELRFVLGMSDSLYDAVSPYLTVMGDGGVNLNLAGRPVLLSLPGMTEESAAYVMRERRAGRPVTDLSRLIAALSPGARAQLTAALPLLRNVVVTETREMHVSSEGWQPGGTTRVRVDAIISRDADGRVSWRSVSR